LPAPTLPTPSTSTWQRAAPDPAAAERLRRLTSRNYTNFDTLRVLGLGGADTFNVTTLTGHSRNLFVEGFALGREEVDRQSEHLLHPAPRPRTSQSAATQDPDAGLVDLNYGTARFGGAARTTTSNR
jgi:hypothetical protein